MPRTYRIATLERQVDELAEALRAILRGPEGQLHYLATRGIAPPTARGGGVMIAEDCKWVGDHAEDAQYTYPNSARLVDAVAIAALAHYEEERDDGE